MDIESSKMESRSHHRHENKQKSWKTEEKIRWEDDTNQFVKPDETEETKGNTMTLG